jgi:vacuolar protein sorting-associated protein 13A/C
VKPSGTRAQGQLVGVALSFLRNFGVLSGASGVLGRLSASVAALGGGAGGGGAEEGAAARAPRNIGGVGEGLVEGGEALAQGFLRGVAGLVQRPLQGAAQAGVGGAPSLARAAGTRARCGGSLPCAGAAAARA